MKRLFRHFLVEEVAEFQCTDGEGTYCEPMHTFKDGEQPEDDSQFIGRFFTVYGKYPAPSNSDAGNGVPGGVKAIYDTPDREDAVELCDWLNDVLKKAGLYYED